MSCYFQLFNLLYGGPAEFDICFAIKAWSSLSCCYLSISLHHVSFCSYFAHIFLSLTLSFPTTRKWSDAASALLIALTSNSDLINLALIQMWSIWFSVRWSGDTFVVLWIFFIWEFRTNVEINKLWTFLHWSLRHK